MRIPDFPTKYIPTLCFHLYLLSAYASYSSHIGKYRGDLNLRALAQCDVSAPFPTHMFAHAGAHSVGAHVRDAGCYVCWAFARAYAPGVYKEKC